MMKARPLALALLAIQAPFLLSCARSWPQWGLNPQHTNASQVPGPSSVRALADIVYDPNVPAARAASGGDLLAHYQVPLLDGTDVYMMFKSGTFTSSNYATQIWSEKRLAWQNGELVPLWEFVTDWKPPGALSQFWEPVFHPVLAGQYLYVPGAQGTIYKVNKWDGSVAAHIDPFQGAGANTYVVTPLSADAGDNIYYSVVQSSGAGGTFTSHDAVDSWLVKVTPTDVAASVSYITLTPGAPQSTDSCPTEFSRANLPWPPSPNAVPAASTCGKQRAGLNVAPAVAPDGTIYTVSRAHFNARWGYLIAVNPDLTLKWATTLRDRFNDGCDVSPSEGGMLPPNGMTGGCRDGATRGVDPATNRPGDGLVLDDSTSSPAVAPDGSIFFAAYTRYNYAQGHLMKFSPAGKFLTAFSAGWDVTPAIYQHGSTYSVVIKENHYSIGSYCSVNAICPPDRSSSGAASPEAYYVTQLTSDLKVEWRYQNTNTESCTRQDNGSVSCVSDHPHGFEWCVNAPVIDGNGVVYANSEDGNLYMIGQGGTLKNSIFQQLAVGAAYTPASLGLDGKVYSQNAGHLFVVGP